MFRLIPLLGPFSPLFVFLVFRRLIAFLSLVGVPALLTSLGQLLRSSAAR